MKFRRHTATISFLATLASIIFLCLTPRLALPQALVANLPLSQTPSGPTVSPESQESVTRLLPGVWPLTGPSDNPETEEAIAIAPIYLDGRTLFHLGAPATEGQNAAELRAQEIQPRLNRIAHNQLEQQQTVAVKIDPPSQLPIVLVDDEQLLTVTSLDAQQNGYVARNEYAIALRETIETALNRYRQERQPDFLRRQAKVAAASIGVALLLLLGSKRIEKRLKRRQTRLINADTQLGKATAITRPPMVEQSIAGRVDSVFTLLKARLDNRQKRKINELGSGLLLLFQVGLCIGSVLWVLWLFPYSRWLTTLLRYWIRFPAQILLIAGLAYIALRIISLIVDKTFLALQEGTQWAPESSERLSLRLITFSQVAKGVAGSFIFGVMVLAMLSTAGVEVGPLLAGAGIIGVGISLAAQSLNKDIINGFLILMEDQFGVGDVVVIGEVAGSVEAINLRITQLRDTEGRLITIPNSQISIVQNLSKDWSQVDLSVSVEPATDLNEALLLLKSIATDMSEESEWQKSILEPPDLLGVESIDSTGITLRLLLKTQPLKQWPVARELRTRIKQAFDRAGISTGVPQERLEIRWEESLNEISSLLGLSAAQQSKDAQKDAYLQKETHQKESEKAPEESLREAPKTVSDKTAD
ncbi:MAG: mechanosensitive ion channel family protein [Phormidesmis sp.]